MDKVAAFILAAGKGTRMKSDFPKVLHQLSNKPLIKHVVDKCNKLKVEKTVVIIGHKGELVQEVLGENYEYAWQNEQLGTGHAVIQAKDFIDESIDHILLICGDTPFLTLNTLENMLKLHLEQKVAATILTACLDNPTGYGRIIRNNKGQVEKIVEQKDGSKEELEIDEINSGVYIFKTEFLKDALAKIKPNNVQEEYYITDVINIFNQQKLKVIGYKTSDNIEIMGINSRIHLAEAEALLKKRINNRLMENGVTIVDPNNTYIDIDVEIDKDTIIYPFSIIKGNTKIGSNCIIGPSSCIEDSTIANNVVIKNSTILKSNIGDACLIGPYSYLRPGTNLDENIKVGDFVEIKNSRVGKGSKIPHLSYIGDSEIGENVNIGAGAITCNYDGVNKWVTKIDDNVFIGSNSNLVAPVTIEKEAFVAAGSTITKDVPKEALGIGREKQKNIKNWVKKNKINKK